MFGFFNNVETEKKIKIEFDNRVLFFFPLGKEKEKTSGIYLIKISIT